PAFKYKGVLVWFAAFSNHCSLFPTASVVEAFKNELTGFSTSKGTIQFPTNKPLPTALVQKLVKARLAQIESKKRRGPSSPRDLCEHPSQFIPLLSQSTMCSR